MADDTSQIKEPMAQNGHLDQSELTACLALIERTQVRGDEVEAVFAIKQKLRSLIQGATSAGQGS